MKKQEIRALVETGILVGIALILDIIFGSFASLYYGGSISLAMLPIFVLAARRGPKYGLIGGFLFGFLSFFLFKGYYLNFLQWLFDYIFAFTVLGVGAFLPKTSSKIRNFILLIVIGSILRLMMASIAGIAYWAEYIPDEMEWIDGIFKTGFSNMTGNTLIVIGSFLYNSLYLIPSAILCILVGMVMFKRGIVNYKLN